MPIARVLLLSIALLIACTNSIAKQSNDQKKYSENTYNVLVILPEGRKSAFWRDTIEYMRAAAASLKLDLTVHYFSEVDKNRFQIVSTITNLLKSQVKTPDMVVSTLSFTVEEEIIGLFDLLKLPLITINTSIDDDVFQRTGKPREKYKYWLAHISPDDVVVGSQLADYLFDHVQVEKKVLIGLGGLFYHTPGRCRSQGLKLAVEKRGSEIDFIQEVPVDWNAIEARIKTEKLLTRHNDVNIIWTASDAMVEGALQAIAYSFPHYTPGENIWLGGINWNASAIDNITNNKQIVSFGGHFVEGGVALILLYDFIHGIDFAQDIGVIFKTIMEPMHKENVATIARQLSVDSWYKIDFTKFTKYHNSELEHYSLTINKLLEISTPLPSSETIR